MIIDFLITYWFEILLFIMAATPSIIIFSIKGRISHWFSKDLKKYEQQLELLKMQKQLQYSNVYTKRAEVIQSIYVLMVELNVLITGYYNTLSHERMECDGHLSNDVKHARKVIGDIVTKKNELKDFTNKNKLYFTKYDSTDILEFVYAVEKIQHWFYNYENNYDEEYSGTIESTILSLYEKYNYKKGIEDIQEKLEGLFRDIIGVNNEKIQ